LKETEPERQGFLSWTHRWRSGSSHTVGFLCPFVEHHVEVEGHAERGSRWPQPPLVRKSGELGSQFSDRPGRQQKSRGELVVSGEVIGASIDGAVEANAQLLSAFRAQSLGKHGHDVQLHAGA